MRDWMGFSKVRESAGLKYIEAAIRMGNSA